MKRFITHLVAMFAIASLGTAHAAITWDGNTDGDGNNNSLFAENNWTTDGIGTDPAAGTIDPNVDVTEDMIINFGNIGPAGTSTAHFEIGNVSLTMTGGNLTMATDSDVNGNGLANTTIDMSGSSTLTLNGTAGGITGVTLNLADTAAVASQFILNSTVNLNGGTLTLRGGGIPLNTSTVDFTSDSGTLRFNDETPAAFRTEHQSNVTVNGITAHEDVNISIGAFNGASGSQITARTDSFGQNVLVDGPLAYYAFTDASGTIADLSGNGNTGTPSGGPSYEQAGLVNDALGFDGNDSVNGGAILNPNAGDFSVEVLINASDLSGGNRALVQQGDAGGTGRTLLFLEGATEEIRSFYGGTGTTTGVFASEDEWYHIVLTVEEGGASDLVSIYVNGILEGTNTVTGETSNGDWILGSSKTQDSQFFAGLFDEFAVYDRLLGADEVLAHARAAGIPTPAALPAGVAMMIAVAARRRRK